MELAETAEFTISQLRELNSLTSNEQGAQRVAWTPIWDRSVEWFVRKAKSLGAEITFDSANNIWAKLEGESQEAIIVGSHIDSVPNGGWLDGALGVAAGLGVLKRYQSLHRKPKKTLYVVAWTDEEGARFGYSCVGSAAASGCLAIDKLKGLKDNDGILLVDTLHMYHLNVENFSAAHEEFLKKNISGYLELHIEQGPLLENQNKVVACVSGITGCYRQYVTFTGQAAHAGSPVKMRHDSFLAAAEAVLEFEKIALKYHGYCTVGKVEVKPDVVTVFPGTCRISLDQRSIDSQTLQGMVKEAQHICRHIATSRGVQVSFSTIWNNPPTIFNDKLVTICQEAVQEETGMADVMYSGPLHDAVEIAKMVPAVMIFVKSEKGLSHCKEENTADEDLGAALRAFFRLADKVLL